MTTHTVKRDTARKWYVIRTYSGHEKKVKAALEREIDDQGLHDKVAEIVIPVETVFEMRAGKKKTKEKVLFSGYVFVNALLDLSIKHVILGLPSVTGFLTQGQGDEPAPLRPDEVNRMIGRMAEAEALGEQPEFPFKPGDAVRIVDGRFNNFEGVVEEVYPDKKKVKVMVPIFGRKTPIELDYVAIEHHT